MNDKNKLINYSLILLLIAILIYLLYPSAKEELPEKIPQKEHTKIDTIEIVESKQKPKDNIKIPVVQQPQTQEVKEPPVKETLLTLEEKPITLASSKTKNSKYIIKLISDQKITPDSSKVKIRYIPFRGTLEEDGYLYNFKFSLQEEYSNSSDTILSIQIVSILKDSVLECDSSFLKYLDKHNIYDIKIDIDDSYASCYISGEREMPDFDSIPKPEIKIENLPPEFLKLLEERKK